jgi:hypothetical protein
MLRGEWPRVRGIEVDAEGFWLILSSTNEKQVFQLRDQAHPLKCLFSLSFFQGRRDGWSVRGIKSC